MNGQRYTITGYFTPPAGDSGGTSEDSGTSQGGYSTGGSTFIGGVSGFTDIAKAAPHPAWVGTVAKGTGVLGTGLKVYSSQWGGNGTTGGKTRRISQAKNALGTVGKQLVFFGAGVRAVEAFTNFRNATSRDERINEVGDATLDVAFALVALVPGPGWIISLTYFAIDNFVLKEQGGVFRTIRRRSKSNPEANKRAQSLQLNYIR